MQRHVSVHLFTVLPRSIFLASRMRWIATIVLLATAFSPAARSQGAQVTVAAVPVISPASGLYVKAQQITIIDTDSNAVIYYTLDGTTPTSASPVYSGPVSVTSNTTVQALALDPNGSASGIATASYSIRAATVYVFPVAGTYFAAQSITMSSTPGASIYYTTDGTTPTAGSSLYTGPVTISSSETIQAIAIASGYAQSNLSTATYVINLPAAVPTISPAGGPYTSVQTVTLSDATPGATIYYTTNGSTPSAASAVYSAPITVAATQTIRALAISSAGSPSTVASAAYTITLPTALPTFYPAAGTYSVAQWVTIADSTPNAAIYYTVDGTTPTTASPAYVGPIWVSNNTQVQAIAAVPAGSASPIATSNYGIRAASVYCWPVAGTYTTPVSVSMSSTPGTSIYYTTDGTTPTTASNLYSAPVTVSTTQQINAMAVSTVYTNSLPKLSAYTINSPVGAPTISPAPGEYATGQTVTLSSATSGAVIYYTINGNAVTTRSPVYSGPLTLSYSQTVSAMAVSSAGTSPIVSAVYTIVPAPATPVFSLAAGKYNGPQTVGISDATAGTAIYFTTDGSTPTMASTPYTGPISVPNSENLQAIAITHGAAFSAVQTAVYAINTSAAVPVISPASGNYATAQTVTIADSMQNVVIYYTVNGSAPTNASPVYSGPFSVSANTVVQAAAQLPNGPVSSVTTATYNYSAVMPVISPAAGTYLASQTVSLQTSTPGASIYYTTNGKAPTTGSTLYTAPITVSANETIEAIAAVSGLANSAAVSAVYTITPPAPAPTLSLAAGTYLKPESVGLKCTNKSAVIYYTTDGSTPTTASAVYSTPITLALNSVETVSAMALAPGGSNSPVSSATYTITIPAATPVISPVYGKYTSVQTVTFADTTNGVSYYYTTDGSTPTAASTLYTGPIQVAVTETVSVIALAPGGAPSSVAKAGYTIVLPTAVPVIMPAGGTYSAVQTVTISDPTPGAVIYYTVNGKFPTAASPVYTGPITATSSTLVQAVAQAPTDSLSGGASQQYNIVVPPPTITPGSGTYDYTATVTMSSPIPGATIYYTNNGFPPNTSAHVYTGPIVLSPTTTTTLTFLAIAVAPQFEQSGESSETVTVTLPSGTIAEAAINPTPSMTIPPDFMGLSADSRTPTSLMGQASSGVNQAYRNLLTNLTQYYTAPLLFRIVGDNVTTADLAPNIEPLTELAQAVNVNYTLGVDMWNNNASLGVAEAEQWVNGIPNNLIQAIEIGNEPDNYASEDARPSSYGFTQYLAQFQQWQQGIQAAVGSSFGAMGPSSANSVWKANTETAFQNHALTPTIGSQHAYCAGPAAGQTLPADYLLEPINATKLPGAFAPLAAAAHQGGLKFRMGEINSIGGGGISGISNTFQSSLWSVDIMFNYLVNGMDGVNWHSAPGTRYNLFDFQSKTYQGQTTFTLLSVNPVYYGVLTFAQLAGRGAQLLPVTPMSDSNVSIWATVDNTSTAHVIVINKDEVATGDVQITLPGYSTGTVRYLSAPGYASTNGITLGGQTFDGTTDGTIQGQLVTTTITGNNGTFTLPAMPVVTAAIIDFSK